MWIFIAICLMMVVFIKLSATLSSQLSRGQWRICLRCNRGEKYSRNGYSWHYRQLQRPNNKCLQKTDWDSACWTQESKEEKRRFRPGVNKFTDKWRDQTYDLKLFYHELDNYLLGKENQDLGGDREEEEGIQRGSNRRKRLSLSSEPRGRHSSNF